MAAVDRIKYDIKFGVKKVKVCMFGGRGHRRGETHLIQSILLRCTHIQHQGQVSVRWWLSNSHTSLSEDLLAQGSLKKVQKFGF